MSDASAPVRLSASRVRRRGWTAPMMAELLGEADLVLPNADDPRLPPVRLYDLERVVAAEDTDRFRQFGTLPAGVRCGTDRPHEAEERRPGPNRRRPIRAPRLLTRFPEADVAEIRRLAVAAHNMHMARVGGFAIEQHAPTAVLDRIAVNYVRHRFTSYDEGIASIPRAKGSSRALDAFRRAVYDAITEQWPELAQECFRQRGQRMTNW